ncbi:MAG: hypothetical protein R3A46_21695 [Thermomicrobiales bacterium]
MPVDHDWYIMHRVETISHASGRTSKRPTCIPEGRDLGGIPVERFVGGRRSCWIWANCHLIVSSAQTDGEVAAAGGVRDGDIVFLKTSYVDLQDTRLSRASSRLTLQAME